MATREEQRKYQREWYAKRRAAWFADKACIRCGSVENLRLDHRDPADKISHNVWSWSEERRNAELAKCQVLCQPCHDWKTTGCGEHATGEANGQSKLCAEDVLAIREAYARGLANQYELAYLFNVAQKTIGQVVHRKTWQHL